jgi:hypothetical protein
MLKGRDGYQVKELDRLIGWLNNKENRPDVIYLSNVLLAGLARALKQEIGVGIVCLLEGEEKFLDELAPPYNRQGWSVLAECVHGIDAFIATDGSYGDVMKKRLEIGQDKIHIVCADNSDAVEADGYDFDKAASGIASVFTGILKNVTEGDYA